VNSPAAASQKNGSAEKFPAVPSSPVRQSIQSPKAWPKTSVQDTVTEEPFPQRTAGCVPTPDARMQRSMVIDEDGWLAPRELPLILASLS
jgi:hypothetical protein